jgi:hypothetical protein
MCNTRLQTGWNCQNLFDFFSVWFCVRRSPLSLARWLFMRFPEVITCTTHNTSFQTSNTGLCLCAYLPPFGEAGGHGGRVRHKRKTSWVSQLSRPSQGSFMGVIALVAESRVKQCNHTFLDRPNHKFWHHPNHTFSNHPNHTFSNHPNHTFLKHRITRFQTTRITGFKTNPISRF